MTQLIETLKENRWRRGKRFLHLFNMPSVLPGGTASVLICTGDEPIVVERMAIEANVELLSWQDFVGTVFTDGTGTASAAIPRNSVASVEEQADVTVTPTITNQGSPFSIPVNLVAQVFRNNFYYMNEVILDGDFTLEPNNCYMVEFKNTSDTETTIEMSLSISNL